MKHIIFFLTLEIIAVLHVLPQGEPDYREIFLEAESYFLFEEYNEALPLYLRLIAKFPENDNINYKIGVCYLNNAYEKEKAITYLEKAVKNINLSYKENNFKETSAPLEAYFHLGNAYRINEEIDKAIETYQQFKQQADPKIYDHELVDEQIRACLNAKELELVPIDIDIRNLGERINTRFSDVNPVVSGDETKLVYIQKQQFYDAVFFSEKINGEWSYPRNIIPEFGVDEDAYPTSLSFNGNELLIYRRDNFIGDLYLSRLVDGYWTILTKLNDNINTKYWESHGCFSRTSDTLYFTSNRKGGYGGLDIYLSIKNPLGEWGIPSNLGQKINSKYNEETPFITSDGKTLYFSSYGHHNMGGYDVFYSNLLDDGSWSLPINAGYPVNTTDDDIFFEPIQNGFFAYFPRFMNGGFGRTDIYKIEIYSTTHPRKFRIKGLFSLPAEALITKPITVKVIESFSRDTVALTYANIETGEFEFEAPAGQYDLLIEGEEIETTTSEVNISRSFIDREIEIKSAILITLAEKLMEIPEPKIVDEIKLSDSLIYVSNDNPVKINMNLERDANLYINVYHDTNYITTDTFRIEKRRFTYEYKPVPGINLLKLKLVNKDGNLSFKDVVVVFTPVESVKTGEQTKTGMLQIVPDTTRPDTTLQNILNEMARNASGELKTFLDNLDLDKTEIMTEADLIEYIKKNAETNNYTSQDVYDLILKQFQLKYTKSYLDQLVELSDNENLRQMLLKLYSHGESITSLQDVYEYMLENATEGNYSPRDVNKLFSLLSQKAEIMSLLENLKGLATDNLKLALTDLDPEKENLRNPIDIMNFLLNNAKKYGYTEAEAMNLLFAYLEKEDLHEIMKILIGTASGSLQDLLITLNLEAHDINKISDLYNYLLEQAKFYDYTESDVVKLFLNLTNILEKEEIIKKVEPLPVTPTGPEKKTGLLYYLIAAGLLIIIIFFVYRRRKDKKEKK